VGDVVSGSAADKAGIKTLDIITKMNGQPLERGDLPVETPAIIERRVSRMKVGDTVTFSVIHDKGDAPHDVMITLEPRPKQPEEAKRFYAEDLGFGVREVVFADTYTRKIPPETTGVVVALIRPQASAQAAHLTGNEMITQMNGKPVTDLDEFKKDYQEFRKSHPHDPVVLQVSQANGKDETINIEPPQNSGAPAEINQ
jgi:S1-C subfamily serine protease